MTTIHVKPFPTMKDGTIIDEGKPDELIKKHGRKNLEEVFLKLTRNKNEL